MDDTTKTEAASLRERVRAYLAEHPNATGCEVIDATGAGPVAVVNTLDAMAAAGEVESPVRSGTRGWRLVPPAPAAPPPKDPGEPGEWEKAPWFGASQRMWDAAFRAAREDQHGWMVWRRATDERGAYAYGPETGQAGRDLADEAIARMLRETEAKPGPADDRTLYPVDDPEARRKILALSGHTSECTSHNLDGLTGCACGVIHRSSVARNVWHLMARGEALNAVNVVLDVPAGAGGWPSDVDTIVGKLDRLVREAEAARVLAGSLNCEPTREAMIDAVGKRRIEAEAAYALRNNLRATLELDDSAPDFEIWEYVARLARSRRPLPTPDAAVEGSAPAAMDVVLRKAEILDSVAALFVDAHEALHDDDLPGIVEALIAADAANLRRDLRAALKLPARANDDEITGRVDALAAVVNPPETRPGSPLLAKLLTILRGATENNETDCVHAMLRAVLDEQIVMAGGGR